MNRLPAIPPTPSPAVPPRRRALAPCTLAGLALCLALPTEADANPFKKLFGSREPLEDIEPAGEPAKDDAATITRAQIYLDSQLFGPGKIDGQIGEFTRKAVAHFNLQRGVVPLSNWGPVLHFAAEAVPDLYTTYTVRSEDFAFIDPSLPIDYPSQALRKSLPYRRLREFLSEKFHSDEPFLDKLNPGVTFANLRPGQTVTVPNVARPFLIETVPKHYKFEEDPVLSARHIIVDTGTKIAVIYETATDELLAMFPITPGQEQFIHRGEWTLRNIVTTPEFRYDKSMLEQGQRSEEFLQIPPGPNSPVGVIWCGTSKSGIGLHGTASPHTIGRSRSAGCIRLANWDAIRLPDLIRPGARVTIR